MTVMMAAGRAIGGACLSAETGLADLELVTFGIIWVGLQFTCFHMPGGDKVGTSD
jgi:hypothetical protein